MRFNTNTNTILYRTLARALSIKRPHNTIGTQQLTRWLIDHLPDGVTHHVDAAGNLHIDARETENNRTLFVAHVDTVHRVTGPNKIRKTNQMWYASANAPLGADDGAGCAMLMHLMHAGVPAYYIFTQGEECGGIGAKHLATDNPELLAQFDRAVAFDRKGIDSVITHQGWSRCCSDAFANALSDALNVDERLMYLPDDTGVYTDTAEFVDIIPECTNISVGYTAEHTPNESLDVLHFATLAKRVVDIDWDGLPTERDPSVTETKWDNLWVEATSVNPSLDYRYHHLIDDSEWLRDDLRKAIYDAMAGSKQWLIELVCESVYPEDPETAEMFIDRKRINDIILTQALEDSHVYDPDVVMATVFDAAYRDR
jgi:hypothetical protein